MISHEKCLEWAKDHNADPAYFGTNLTEGRCFYTLEDLESLINRAYAEGQKKMEILREALVAIKMMYPHRKAADMAKEALAATENEGKDKMSMEYGFRNKYELQAENKRLKAELKAISQALDDPRTDLTMTMLEVIRELKGQTK